MVSDPVAAAPPVIYLHIGAMKTGTSYLQRLLADNRDRLKADGLLFPGEYGWRDQVWAARDILDMVVNKNLARRRYRGSWDRVSAQMLGFDGHAACFSMEYLSFADAEHATRLVESLAPAEVHVVLTLRDPSRVLPSAWQEWTQNRGTGSWREYIATARAGAGSDQPSDRAYRRVLDLDRILDSWTPLVPAERFHVVTVPPPGSPPGLLWERFASVIGVDAGRYAQPVAAANESLGYTSADLMWRVNRELTDLGFSAYESIVKQRLCKDSLAGRDERTQIPLPREVLGIAESWAKHAATRVRTAGLPVVGDLADLSPDPARFTEGIEPTPTWQLLDAAADALAGLGTALEEQRERRRRVAAELGVGEPHPGERVDDTGDGADNAAAESITTVDDLDPADPDSIDIAVERVGEQIHRVVRVWQQADRLRRPHRAGRQPASGGSVTPAPRRLGGRVLRAIRHR